MVACVSRGADSPPTGVFAALLATDASIACRLPSLDLLSFSISAGTLAISKPVSCMMMCTQFLIFVYPQSGGNRTLL